MIKINETPIRTSENYGINAFEIDENQLVHKKNSSPKISIENLNCCNNVFEIKQKNPLSEIVNEQGKNADLNLSFNIADNEKTFKKLTINIDEDIIENLNFNFLENSKSKLAIHFVGSKKSFHNAFINLNGLKNSEAEILVLNETNVESTNLLNIESELEQNAKVKILFVNFMSNITCNKIQASLKGDYSNIDVETLYLGGGNTKNDLNVLIDVFGTNCVANINSVGALMGCAEKSFKGIISFKRGSKKSVGKENETCLLLSKSAKSKALPAILCEEEDVDGSHSSSIGKLGEKELFYLMSRGLTKQEANRLFVMARFNLILNDIFDEDLKTHIKEKIEKGLDNEEL